MSVSQTQPCECCPNTVGGVVSIIPASAGKRTLALVGNVIGVVSLILAALFRMALSPWMPVPGLDTSWVYALNVAVERGLVFGRDIIFTFGPLASIYTRGYSPATDTLMLAGSALFACGMCAGVALALTPGRLAWAVVLPVLLAMQWLGDSAYLPTPFLFILVVARTQLAPSDRFYLHPTRWVQAGIALLAIAVGILPLIKGSFAGVASVSYVLVLAMLALRRNWRAALALALLGILTLCLAWVSAGQPLEALPNYFIAQVPIISGYTEAMSLRGPAIIPWLVGGVFLIIVIWFYFSFGRGRGLIGAGVMLGLALILFIIFKAAMVRQDTHVFMATGALLLIALAVTARSTKWPALLIWILVLATWVRVANAVPPEGFFRNIGYFVQEAWGRTTHGLETRLFHPGSLPAAFDEANAKIRASVPLPATLKGTVDLYPTELSAIFANHLAWNGRPVFQSYSAYTPRLDRLNADHLERAGADTVFFAFDTFDNRLAALDDAGSLIVLLGRYSVVAYNGAYVQFSRHAGPSTATIDPSASFTGTARLGERVAVQDPGMPLWASVDIQPTRLGKLVSALYKLPQLEIELTLDNGQVQRRRFIASMGHSGFILSPFLNRTEDMLALAGSVASVPKVVSFKIGVEAPGGWENKLWKSKYAIELRPIHIAGIVKFDPAQVNPKSCEGFLDQQITDNVGLAASGWAMAYDPSGQAFRRASLLIVLVDANGQTVGYGVTGQNRSDVAAVYKNNNAPGDSGWTGFANRDSVQPLRAYAYVDSKFCPLH